MILHTESVRGKILCRDLVVLGVVAVVVIVLLSVFWWRFDLLPKQMGGQSLPDITKCTRVEVQFGSQIADDFSSIEPNVALLNAAEAEYIRSLGTVVFDDPGVIRHLARILNSAVYTGHTGGNIRSGTRASIICYHDAEPGACLTIVADRAIVDEQGHIFQCEDVFAKLTGLPPLSPLGPLHMRLSCAVRMIDLYSEFWRPPESLVAYPQPTGWCDAIAGELCQSGVTADTLRQFFACPGAGRGKCHYAMNSNCRYDSPADMVLLFETKGGWNQHGGPELFTFDNHDPEGGCVLLNDGTVKFIRTEEELKQLRWK